MKTPLSPSEDAARLAAFIERERERLLRVRGRRAVLPLVHRLIREDTGNVELAAEVARVGEDRGVVLPPGRTADDQRKVIAGILLVLRPHVRTYTAAESAASSAFFDFLDEWTAVVN